MNKTDVAAGILAGLGILTVLAGLVALEGLIFQYGIKFITGYDLGFLRAVVLSLLLTLVGTKFKGITKSKE